MNELEQELKRSLQGEVRFDQGSRAMYASDGSNYRQVPIGLVIPRDADDVVAAMAACRKYGAPVLARGAGTSLAGQCCNMAVVFDFTKYMHRILELDPRQRFARVQPGVVLDTLRNQAEQHHLTFAPDPSTHNRCTIGGMIGNNSCGTHSLLGGKTVDNVEELRILLYDGTQMTVGACTIEGPTAIEASLRSLGSQYANLIRARFPQIPRRVSGYNLDDLLPEQFHLARALVGTEGTCVTILEAKLRLIPSPQHRALVGIGYRDAFVAADDVPEILTFHPIGFEGFEGSIVDGLRRKGAANLDLLPEGRGIVLVEFGSDDSEHAIALAQQLLERLRRMPDAPNTRVYTPAEARVVWQLREAGPRAAAFAPGAAPQWEGWDDAAVAPQKLGGYLRDIRALMDEYGYEGAFYGHFGHGCIHMRVSFDLQSEKGIRTYSEFIDRAADLVVSYGGSLSGEHGDGQARGALLPKMFGPELMQAFRQFKAVWDPQNKMNPHKVVDAYLPTENLRLIDYKPQLPQTHFKFIDDGGSFANAAARCIGVGTCRKQDAGSMCPSYMVTLEEEHSTRGRAHMLFEMLQGEVLHESWKNQQVKQALDLCLSCKACKSECPANVDLATYKAEFLAHYYQHHRRPLHAYAFGRIDRWAHLGSNVAGLANRLSTTSVAKRLLGLAPERALPRLNEVTFQQWAARQPSSSHDKRVIIFADTFNNYFSPEISKAAYAVLTDAGFQVTVPKGHLCCGRPLYDFGMLDLAKKYLQRILQQLDTSQPIVVLEPSCASVFRDELPNLFPGDERAERLRSQTFLLSEFLARHNYQPSSVQQKILLHGHCHQKSIMKMTDEQALLRKTGADVQTLDSGCCGMAGPFGFEKAKYAVSQAIGERVLLPAVRKAESRTLIVTNGFSCREQIQHGTGRRALHLAEVLNLARRL